ARRGQKLLVTRDALPEPDEDEFYLTDLIGLEGRDPADVVLGKVKSVQNFGADDMLEIAPAEGGPTWYLPFTREAAPELHIDEGWLRIVRPTEVSDRDEDWRRHGCGSPCGFRHGRGHTSRSVPWPTCPPSPSPASFRRSILTGCNSTP